ncbi:MAG: DUF2130 domain-containing protein [Candidatus Roizmanbacteria bacterium]
MTDQIICPHCKKPILLNEAISHEMQEKYEKDIALVKNSFEIKIKEWEKIKVEEQEREREKIRNEARKWKEEVSKKLQDENELKEKDIAEKTRERMRKEFELSEKTAHEEREELQKRNEKLNDQLLEIMKQLRQMKTEREEEKLISEKKLTELEDNIRKESRNRIEEEFNLKIAEKDKKIQDALKMVDDYKRKVEQGSQQMQGEVLELELESLLKKEFPYDSIEPVAKGVRGADIVQKVRSNMGSLCGTIVWETKRTKSWSNEWVVKLKDDQRVLHAEWAVLVSQVLPEGINHIGRVEGVWVSDYEAYLGVATLLRSQIIEVSIIKNSSEGKKEKMEVLYSYLSGTEFTHRVEAIVEAFTTIQDDIEKEKRWFAQKWSKQEKNIRKVIDNTLGMHGDLQSIMGNSLADIKGIELLSDAVELNE